ncbi:hypothetical protein HDU96_008807 [Phlyctochytrium bullatum]|nr:hypothetical protein HDU96_008807 [Phlyctochytrium bullatum]
MTWPLDVASTMGLVVAGWILLDVLIRLLVRFKLLRPILHVLCCPCTACASPCDALRRHSMFAKMRRKEEEWDQRRLEHWQESCRNGEYQRYPERHPVVYQGEEVPGTLEADSERGETTVTEPPPAHLAVYTSRQPKPVAAFTNPTTAAATARPVAPRTQRSTEAMPPLRPITHLDVSIIVVATEAAADVVTDPPPQTSTGEPSVTDVAHPVEPAHVSQPPEPIHAPHHPSDPIHTHHHHPAPEPSPTPHHHHPSAHTHHQP